MPVTSLRKACVRPTEVAKIKIKIKIQNQKTKSKSRYSTTSSGECGSLCDPSRKQKKPGFWGGESGLRPLGVKQRHAVPWYLYRHDTWGRCRPTVQVLISLACSPVSRSGFLNKFGIRSLQLSSHCAQNVLKMNKKHRYGRMIRAFLRKLGIIRGFEF